MTNDIFIEQNLTFIQFIQIYCDDYHADVTKTTTELELFYNGIDLKKSVKFKLCADCTDLFFHVNERLSACPHDPKPKCRQCKSPCYEKSIYRKIAKIMRSSGIKLGLSKIKNIFKIK